MPETPSPTPRTASPAVADRGLSGADGVRALACLWVFGHHVALVLDLPQRGLARFFAKHGAQGVPVFFVLSGFLLTLPFWRAFDARRGLPDLRMYAVRRLARIVPAYYVCLLAMFVAFPRFTPFDFLRLVLGLTFTNSFHWTTFFPARVNGPCWSIGIEMWFYLLLPLWAAGLVRTRGLRAGRLYAIGTMAVLAAAQFVLVRSVPQPVAPPDRDPADLWGIAVLWLPMRNPFGLFAHFLCGSLAASFLVRPPATVGPGAPERGARWNRFDTAVALLFVALGIDLYARHVPGAEALPAALGDALNTLWGRRHALFMDCGWPSFPLLVGALLVALARSATIGRTLDREPLRTTARLSYGIYLWHMPVVHLMNQAFLGAAWLATTAGVGGFSAVALALSYAIAWASYRFLEKPVLDWSRRFERPPGARPG